MMRLMIDTCHAARPGSMPYHHLFAFPRESLQLRLRMKNVKVAILTDLVLVGTPARRPRLPASHSIATT